MSRTALPSLFRPETGSRAVLGRGLAACVLLRAVTAAVFGLGRRGGVVIKTIRAFAYDAATDETLHHSQFGLVFVRHKTEGVTHGVGSARASDPVDVILG